MKPWLDCHGFFYFYSDIYQFLIKKISVNLLIRNPLKANLLLMENKTFIFYESFFCKNNRFIRR